MVNLTIHLKKKHDAKELVKLLLTEKLIATASIDENNVSYSLENENVIEELITVVTAQTKSLLFDDISKAVFDFIKEDTLINITPIVGSNKFFYDTIKSKTVSA